MFRYSPPKASIWGHSLRNMAPAKQKGLFAAFLERAVGEHSFTGGSLTLFVGSAPAIFGPIANGPWGHVALEDVQRFERLLGTDAREHSFHSLTPLQCEIALSEISRNDALIPGVSLSQNVEVSSWLIDGERVPTQSQFMLFFGMKPCISTSLQFQTLDQFEFVKRVLAELKFCKLNEKHLKTFKRRVRLSDRERVDA